MSRVSLMSYTLFISDLHLCEERPQAQALFKEFLQAHAGRCDALYILGDLFEAWVGDDDDSAATRDVVEALATFSAAGTPLYVMHGNRDFMLSGDFAGQSGAELIDDPLRVELYGKPVLLSHGDIWCTDDTEYQQFRAMSRQPAWQAGMMSKPLAERQAIAQGMRAQSIASKSNAPAAIMDVNQEAIAQAFREHGVDCIIHGHTHRPAVHELELDGRAVQRIVLAEWTEQGRALKWSPNGYEDLAIA